MSKGAKAKRRLACSRLALGAKLTAYARSACKSRVPSFTLTGRPIYPSAVTGRKHDDPERNPVWPYWPARLLSSSSHEEGVARDWSIATKEFTGEGGKVKALKAVRLDWKDGRMNEIPDSEFTLPADLVLLAMGFVSPAQEMLDAFGVAKDARGNAEAPTDPLPDGARPYATSVAKVFAAGDMRRGQSLVVWAIREGRQCARGGRVPDGRLQPAALRAVSMA